MSAYSSWTPKEAAGLIAVPRPSDDKYSRGVLGVVTGSTEYPGAAVLGVEAALHTGVGMVRYLGPERPTALVLARRPEAVTVPGRVQAWLLGSGMPADEVTAQRRAAGASALLATALASGQPLVLDAGALDLVGEARGPVVVTPHHGELARMLGADPAAIAADAGSWARRAAEELGVTVLLKGNVSHIAGPGRAFRVEAPTSWLATAGTGDALGGILGALLATHAEEAAGEGALARLAATASLIHGLAAERASGGGPFTVLGLCAAIPAVVAGLLVGESSRGI